MSWLQYFLFETIPGIILLCLPVLWLGHVFHKLLKGSNVPYYVSGVLCVLIFCTVISIPRFQFEKSVIEQTEGVPWLHLAHKMREISLVEPLTWFNGPSSRLTFVGPWSKLYSVSGDVRDFREIIFQYKEDTLIYKVQVYCKEGKYDLWAPNDQGKFELLNDELLINAHDQDLYCDRDWTAEHKALPTEVDGFFSDAL